MPYLSRTRFKKEIVAEFAKPEGKSNKVIIYCDGAPTVPNKGDAIEFWANKGYWVFYIRYRGCWESGGKFLKESLENEVLDVLDELPKGFTDFMDDKTYTVQPKKVVVIGGSFGGPAAILATRDKRVQKAIAISPVVDWTYPSKAEPMDWLYGYMRNAFGEGYRFDKKDWDRLARGEFYNPVNHIDEIFGKKLFMVHAMDDESVDYRPVKEFAEKTGATLVLKRSGGHLSSRILTKSPLYKKIAHFLDK